MVGIVKTTNGARRHRKIPAGCRLESQQDDGCMTAQSFTIR